MFLPLCSPTSYTLSFDEGVVLCGLVLSHQTLCWFSQIFINTKNTITIDIIWYSVNLAFHLSCLPVVLSHDYNNNLQEFAKEKILWVRINDCLLILNVYPMNLYTITTLLLLVGALHFAYCFTFEATFRILLPSRAYFVVFALCSPSFYWFRILTIIRIHVLALKL